MQPVSRTAVILIFAALFAIISSWYAWINITTRLSVELRNIEERFDKLVADHGRFAALANEALQAREIINREYGQRCRDLEECLDANPAWADCPVPDPLRMHLQYGPDCNAASGTAGPDATARPQQHPDQCRPDAPAPGR